MKTKRLTIPEIAALLFTVLFCAFLFLSSRFDKIKVWPDVRPDYENGKASFSLENGDSYGIKSSGPYYDLPAGKYRLKWRIDGDGENIIHLFSSAGARIVPDTIRTAAGQWEGETAFDLLDAAHNFSIGVEFASGTRMTVDNLRLYSPGYKDHAFLFLFAAAAFWVIYLLRRLKKLTVQALYTLAILFAAAAFSCSPSFSDTVYGWDFSFHASRIMNLADELASLQIPGRVGGFSYNGWGGATSVFYPDLFLYPSALMILCGASVTFVLNSLIFGAALLTCGCMYAAARRFLRDDSAGLCASVLYTLSMYRLMGIYNGLMIGEMLSMAFLPLVLLSEYNLFYGDAGYWRLLVLSAFAVFCSHLLTTLIVGILSVLFFLFSLSALKNRERLRGLVLCVFCTALLCIHRLVPLIQLQLSGVTSGVLQYGFAENSLSVSRLVSVSGRLGIVPLLSLLAALCVLREKDAPLRRQILILIAVSVFFAVLSSAIFPWNRILAYTELPRVLQFPWRFLCYTTLFSAFCGGYGLTQLFQKKAVFLSLVLAVLCSSFYLSGVPENEKSYSFGEGASPYLVTSEYQIDGTDVNDTRSRTPILSDGVTLTAYEKKGTAVDASLSAQRDGSVALPMFGFDGYEVLLDGSKTDWTLTGNNRLTVAFSAGEHTLSVRYAGKTLWRVCDFLSLVTLVLFGMSSGKEFLRKKEIV